MNLDPDEIYERLVRLGDAWADALAASEILDETKKILLSQLGADSNESSQAAKEAYALRHPDYKAHIEAMVRARKAANRARVQLDSAKIWSELKRTEAANERFANRSAV